jgi:hypothetical protein
VRFKHQLIQVAGKWPQWGWNHAAAFRFFPWPIPGFVSRTDRHCRRFEPFLFAQGECAMTERRRVKQTRTLEERLAEEAKRLRERAELLPHGPLREEGHDRQKLVRM